MPTRIIEALHRGDADEALNLARDWTEREPEDAQAHRWLGVTLQQAGDINAARFAIERALLLEPQDADLHYLHAALLLDKHDISHAQDALSRSIDLNPNQFEAYIMQAQLAIACGDLDGAERMHQLATRVRSGHPQLDMIGGLIALRRHDADTAMRLLSTAAERRPDDIQLRHALGFAYLQAGHHAFAEQALRSVLEARPDARALRATLAELLRVQERHQEAADMLEPLLADPADSTPAILRYAGTLALAKSHHERALELLTSAFASAPNDRATIAALLEAWRESGHVDAGRETLDAALQANPQAEHLWHARLALEESDIEKGVAVANRWRSQMPQSPSALEATLHLCEMQGDDAGADAAAKILLTLQPGHTRAETRMLARQLQTQPQAALDRIDHLLASAQDPMARQLLSGWRGLALDALQRPAEAVDAWQHVQQAQAERLLQLPALSHGDASYPAMGAVVADAPAVAFLYAPPGSRGERIAAVLGANVAAFAMDRISATPPDDRLQDPQAFAQLNDGTLSGDSLIAQWRAALPARGRANGQIIDWLLWWDNALLHAMRPHLPDALLLATVRDPRDMLLDWLAFGAYVPLRFPSPRDAALWLAQSLNQLCDLRDRQWFPITILRIDDALNDPDAMAHMLGEALATPLPEEQPLRFNERSFAAGHWREYRGALADAFAMLSAVAARLGYPEN